MPNSRPPNPNTIAPSAFVLPDLGGVQEALDRAWREARMVAVPQGPGVHLFCVHGSHVYLRFLAADSGDHAVLGRHDQCDVFLRSDPAVSLRHILARPLLLDDGTVALRLLDLMTSRPFVVADGTLHRSLVATGPFAVAVGDYVIGGIPKDAALAGPTAGPYRDPAVVESSTRVPDSALRTGAGRRSRITSLPSSRFVTQVPSWPDEGHVRVALSRGADVCSLVLHEHTLTHGVLIGRAPRCLQAGFERVLSASISRVHLLLLRDRGEDFAIDLASTQGTRVHDARLREVRLPARAHLTLGKTEPVELVWDRTDV